MCIIAGYSGNRPAAPILAEIMKKQEYVDGGLSTGIATIHEGKLYYRKVVGDLETLLAETDALSLPGTTGIMHSRTGSNGVEFAHPFISNDGNIALITNGTTGEVKCPEFYEEADAVMRHFLERGFVIKSAKEINPENAIGRNLPGGKDYMLTEPYLFMIEEALEGVGEEELRSAIADATRKAINALPRNFVTANVHAKIPDTITVGNCARPVTVGFGDGETFFASCGFALPEYVTKRPVISLPPTSVSQISPKGLEILSTSLENARVEQIDFRIARDMMNYLDEVLVGAEDAPVSVYDVLFGKKDWSETWSKPYNEGKFKSGKGYFKPYASLFYEALFAYHKQGRLHVVDGERNGCRITKFWADKH